MKKIILTAFLIGLLLSPQLGFAQERAPEGFCTFATGSAVLNDLFLRICNVVFGIGIFVVAVFIVISGIYFVIARGDADKITTARNFILYAIVGAVVMFAALAVIALAKWIGVGG